MTVTLKSHGDGINIMLDSLADFATISADLRKKVSDAKQFFEGTSTNVSFLGRGLLPEEEKTLLEIITTETTMSVTLVDYKAPVEPPIPKKKGKPATESKPELEPLQKAASTPQPLLTHPPKINCTESNTAYYQNGLRSGQSIKFKGSVVVLGDANPGSEIVADGNVIVLGALKGMAHAGAGGDSSCFVSALALLPTQLRISNIITYVPQPEKGKKEVPKPSIAYVKEGQVFVGPL